MNTGAVGPYFFRHFRIPESMMGGLERYVTQGIRPGSFLQAVIANDLIDACGRADPENLANLPAFVAWLENEAPRGSYGSREAMEGWISRGQELASRLRRSQGGT